MSRAETKLWFLALTEAFFDHDVEGDIILWLAALRDGLGP